VHALSLFVLLSAQPANEAVVRVRFDTLALKDAEKLNGKLVVTTFTVGSPAYTWGEGKNLITVIAPKPAASSEERTVILNGNRLHDADMGAKVTVVGTLRVIHHPASTIGTTTFSGFTEIRIREQ
jgi:hypothetical protein